MHDVTKILVVFAAVLALLLSALTMAYSANAERITGDYRDQVARADQAEAEARAQLSSRAQEVATLQQQIEALNNALQSRDGTIASLQAERTNLRAEREQAVNASSAVRNGLEQLQATVDTQAQLITNYREEVTQLRNEQLAASRREIELLDRNNDLESQREVLEQTARALREQLAEAQLAVQNAQSGTRTARANQPFESTGPVVRGTVSEVRRTEAGDDLAVIDVGTESGVRENMRMTIVRGGQFVANLVVLRADPRQAVGRIDRLGRQVEIRQGDRVQSRFD